MRDPSLNSFRKKNGLASQLKDERKKWKRGGMDSQNPRNCAIRQPSQAATDMMRSKRGIWALHHRRRNDG